MFMIINELLGPEVGFSGESRGVLEYPQSFSGIEVVFLLKIKRSNFSSPKDVTTI
jgi:hypothetical protein